MVVCKQDLIMPIAFNPKSSINHNFERNIKMQTLMLNAHELTMNELELVAGGAWSWKEFGRSTANGVVTGAVGGAVAGGVAESAAGGVGALPGAAAGAGWGAVGGGLAGAAGYLATGWW
ncbi:hypothetical protein [Neisseria wadsworthii]|uniref:Bacteriocin n=1 Tax=Neisseria wadsworthii 9715 TaxID=1030841 RepID=G4CSL3_9NEIS|nr:hypothetical protein [Neisseria wadsworthii]EGZ44659.1 hypothetical protein HMPREF9370_2073 [Neisseria wadsworthii 9715]QMT35700.1 hypothetical protein H3L96_11950 [Neisseria wadsworthii]